MDKGGTVLLLLVLATGLWMYRTGRLDNFGGALNGRMIVNR